MNIKIENESFDVVLSKNGGAVLTEALNELRRFGETITAKQILAAYLNKAAECEKLKTQLAEIESLVSTAV